MSVGEGFRLLYRLPGLNRLLGRGRRRTAKRLAETDALTGLPNSRRLRQVLGDEVAQAQRSSRALTLVILDINQFKKINDRLGHAEGDRLLAALAELIQEEVGEVGTASRIGGDEFALVLPGCTLEDAGQFTTRLRERVARWSEVRTEPIVLSAGAAELRADDDPAKLIARADDELYRGKRPPPDAGVREPRRPNPSTGSGHATAEIDG